MKTRRHFISSLFLYNSQPVVADLLNLEVVGDPESEVAEDEEGDDLSARLLPPPALLIDLLLLQVRDEEKLEVHLNP
jgi:hypothetical protein